MEPQANNENYDKELYFTHPCIGEIKFFALNSQSLMHFRDTLDITTELYFFTNYYFEFRGSKLNELYPLQQLTDNKEMRINIVFTPFDYRSSQYHVAKTMDVVFNPEIYLFICKSKMAE